MRRTGGLLLFLLGSLALCACRGEIALGGAEGDGGIESSAPATSSMGSGSGGSGSSSSAGCTPAPGGSSSGGSDATPVLLAQLQAPSGIVVDATYAYVASYEVGPLNRVALDGSGVVQLDSVSASTIAVNAVNVYTVSSNGPGPPQGLVVGCAKTGCNGQYTTLASGQTQVWGVAADDTNVYWTNQGPPGPGLFKAPVGGGAPVSLGAPGPADAVVASGGRVFYAGATASTGTESGIRDLLSVSANGDSPTVLVVSPDPTVSVQALTVDCVNVYYATNDGTIAQIPIGGGIPTTLATGGRQGLQMAVDADRVYFSVEQGLASVPIGGGAVTTLAMGVNLSGIAVDANNVYWTNLGDGTVMKLTK